MFHALSKLKDIKDAYVGKEKLLFNTPFDSIKKQT